jgi:hypothetical protein
VRTIVLIVAISTPVVAAEPTDWPKPIQVQHIRIVPISAGIEKIKTIQPRLLVRPEKILAGAEALDRLVLLVEVQNLAENKRVEFFGWHAGPLADIIDEHENDYRSLYPVPDKLPVRREVLDPLGRTKTTICIERPIAAATELRVELRGYAVGVEEEFAWRLKRADWTPKSARKP